jgi:hypothetical protein
VREYRLRLKRLAPIRPRPDGAFPFKSSTLQSLRGSCPYDLFPWVPLLRFAFWFAEGFGSRFLPRATAIPSTAKG